LFLVPVEHDPPSGIQPDHLKQAPTLDLWNARSPHRTQ